MAKRKPAPAANENLPTPEEYTVLARRYRPQAFADLVGQEPVAQALINAIQSNRVAHAYLFTGARGVGKTSTARILAKSLNCEKGPTPTPCNECDQCRAVASGDDIDVLEIDGASNRGIDEVREIRQNVQFRPSRARYKIYIIDEVHMLTPPAFNALLKTLEEPPAHVKFIFATTEVQKIPVTILSRCQRFDFAGIGIPQIVNRLREIVSQEKMKADEEALELIARRANSSMRDAQSLLDQLLAFSTDKLTVAQVHQLLGTANEERVAELAGAILEHDAKKALGLLNQAIDEGLQLGEFLDQLMDYWRDLMIAQCTGVESQIFSVSGGHREQLYKQAQAKELDAILAGLDVLASAKARLRSTVHGRALIEMAVVRLCRLDNLVSIAQLAQALESGGTMPARPATKPPSLTAALDEKKKPETVAESPAPDSNLPLTEANLEQVWSLILNEVGGFLANELRKAERVAIFGPNTVAIRFPSGYNADGSSYWDPTRTARIEQALRKFTGQPCNLRVEVSTKSPVGQPGQAEPPESAQSRVRRQRAEVMKQPLLSRAMELLGAQVVHMDEGFGSAAAAPAQEPEAEEM